MFYKVVYQYRTFLNRFIYILLDYSVQKTKWNQYWMIYYCKLINVNIDITLTIFALMV